MAKTQSSAIRIAWLPPELNRAPASISRALGASVAGELNAVTTGRPSRVAANFLERHVKDFDHLAERAGRIEGGKPHRTAFRGDVFRTLPKRGSRK